MELAVVRARNLHLQAARPPERADLALHPVRRVEEDSTRLGHAHALHQNDAEALFEAAVRRVAERGRRAAREAHAPEALALRLAMLLAPAQQLGNDRRHDA